MEQNDREHPGHDGVPHRETPAEHTGQTPTLRSLANPGRVRRQ